VWDLQGLAAGAALACSTLAAYFDRRSRGRCSAPSWLFLHKMACILGHQPTNTSTSYRQTLKALSRFGLPPLEYGPSDPKQIDEPPEGFLFSFAREYAELVYVRLDHSAAPADRLATTIKRFLAAGFPLAFGVSLFQTESAGPELPFPSAYEIHRGGAALVAAGYDDKKRVHSERGALRVRTPWGQEWGEGGYGWLPYRYLSQRLAGDFWTILRPDWVVDGDFSCPV
jgi:C1A family cysteine protease